MSDTVTRFAPSPTGYLHVGNLRTALMNWMIARKAGGTFILRLDDTDPQRSEAHFADAIREDLDWLGLTWDREERQSERLDLYHDAAKTLRHAGRLYEAWETPTELDLKRKKQLNMGKPPVYDRAALALSEAERDAMLAERGSGVWRFQLDHERIEWTDGILGDQSIDAASVSDPVLIRMDGQFLYTLASVVDDTQMGVTHVVRGSDHVTNTATQIQIMAALGHDHPSFAHHSLLTGPQGEALSKRLGTLSLRDLRDQGVEPMALLSLMARLGSSQPVALLDSPEALAQAFDVSQFGAAPTKFNEADLVGLSASVIQALPYDAMALPIAALGVPAELRETFWSVVRDNITARDQIADWWTLMTKGARPLIAADDQDFVTEAFQMLPEPPYDAETWKTWTSAVGKATGRKGKKLFMPLRHAVTGREKGPDMGDLMSLMQVKPKL